MIGWRVVTSSASANPSSCLTHASFSCSFSSPSSVSSLQFCMLIYHMLITVAKREQFRETTAVGYSCVLFGWMTLLAVKQPGARQAAAAAAQGGSAWQAGSLAGVACGCEVLWARNAAPVGRPYQ